MYFQCTNQVEKVRLYNIRKKLPILVVGKIISWDRNINILVESPLFTI